MKGKKLEDLFEEGKDTLNTIIDFKFDIMEKLKEKEVETEPEENIELREQFRELQAKNL
jgi:hypothetical protein